MLQQLVKPIDPIFYIYILLSLFMAVMIILILSKSRSAVNYLFSLTPFLFLIVLLLNLVEYIYDIEDIIPRIPYLFASLGVYYAGVYIFEGKAITQNRRVLVFSVAYFIYAIAISIALTLVEHNLYIDSSLDPTLTGLMHISIGIPVLFSLSYYYKVKTIVPEQKLSINVLLIGSLTVIIGAFIRGMNFIITQTTTDSIPGLVIIMLGSIIIIISFSSLTRSTST